MKFSNRGPTSKWDTFSNAVYKRGGGVLVGEKNMLECYPEYKDFLKRPCKVLSFEMKLNKTKLFLMPLRSWKLRMKKLVKR